MFMKRNARWPRESRRRPKCHGLNRKLVASGGALGALSRPPTGSMDIRSSRMARRRVYRNTARAFCAGVRATPGGRDLGVISAVLEASVAMTHLRPCVQNTSHPIA